MSAQLQHLADIITKAAGWKNAAPDAEGVFRFSLEGGLDFSLLTPENWTAVFPLHNNSILVKNRGEVIQCWSVFFDVLCCIYR